MENSYEPKHPHGACKIDFLNMHLSLGMYIESIAEMDVKIT